MISCGEFEVVAIASRSQQKADESAKMFNIEGIGSYDDLLLLNDIDAVYIPLPTGMHHEWILKSLNAGKHVFSEKSFTQNIEETKEIIELAKSKELCVFENFMFPYHSQFEKVFELIEKGAIGELRVLRSSFGFPPFDVESNIRYKEDLGGGALLDAGAYTLMAAQLFLGKNLEILSSDLNEWGREVDFHGAIMLKNAEGVIGQLAFGFENFYQNNIELWGTEGKITVNRAFTAAPGFEPFITLEQQGVDETIKLAADNHYEKILLSFAEAIHSKNFSKQFDQILNQSKLISDVQSRNN